MRYRSTVCAALVLFMAATAMADSPARVTHESYGGSVYDAESGRLLYTEKHRATFKGGALEESKTAYIGPDNRPWGTLTSRPSSSTDRYTYAYEDTRSGELHGVNLSSNRTPMMYRRESRNAPTEKEAYEHDEGAPTAVAGQHFHWYLRSLLLEGQLSVGQTRKVRLLLPGRFDYFTFEIRVQRAAAGKLYLSLNLNSRFLRLFASAEMKLTYEQKTGRLLEYLGPTHVPDIHGKKSKSVRIRYVYD